MATLAVQPSALAGLEVVFTAAAAGGDEFANDGVTQLHVANGAGAPITVTVAAQRACNQGSLHDSVTVVTNGESRTIGPFPRVRFNDADGNAQVTYSAAASVTVAVVTQDLA